MNRILLKPFYALTMSVPLLSLYFYTEMLSFAAKAALFNQVCLFKSLCFIVRETRDNSEQMKRWDFCNFIVLFFMLDDQT